MRKLNIDGARYPLYAGAVQRLYKKLRILDHPNASNELYKTHLDDYRRLGKENQKHGRTIFWLVEKGYARFPLDLHHHFIDRYGWDICHHELFEVETPNGAILKNSGIRVSRQNDFFESRGADNENHKPNDH